MPQSLIKTPPDAAQALQHNGRALIASHEQISGVLRSRLGANHADLLAAPRVDADGSIAWSTALAGAVLPAAQLPEDERQKLRQRAERIAADIRGLAQQLRGEGPASQLVAQLIERALQQPPGDWLYSVGGKPVLAMWGHAAAGAVLADGAAGSPGVAGMTGALPAAAAAMTAATPAATPAAPPAAPPAAAGVTAAATAALSASAGIKPAGAAPWQRWLPWLLLALAVLAALLFGLRRCSEAPADSGLDRQLAELDARNQSLADELAKRRAQPPQLQCVPDAPPPAASAAGPAAEPAWAASAPAPEPPASQPPPAVDPLDALKKRIADAGSNCDALQGMLRSEPLLKGADASSLKQQIAGTMAKNCREKLIREAKNLCPGQRPKEFAPEMVIVFDASGSMNFSLDVTDAQIRQSAQAAQVDGLMRQFGLGGLGAVRGGGGLTLDQLQREPKRITVAKRAALSVAQRLPSDMNVGLVLIEQCSSARSVGFYSPGQRGSLIGQLQGIQPKGGTPLADGIAKGGQMLDGVNKESLMLVVSDGVESCGQDPCAVASALARAKPRLRINVVDITGTGAGNCVAQATGGKVFTANNASQLLAVTDRAAQEAMGPANCRR